MFIYNVRCPLPIDKNFGAPLHIVLILTEFIPHSGSSNHLVVAGHVIATITVL